MKNRAIFFDKDGVLNEDNGCRENTFAPVLNHQAASVISKMRSAGFKIFVVTNQTTIARGIIGEEKIEDVFYSFQQLLISDNPNGLIDKFYFCPHHPEATVKRYRTDCECRKPKSGMLTRAGLEFDIDLFGSFMIGDRVSDIVAGNNAGCTTVLLETKHESSAMIISNMKIKPGLQKPNHKISNLSELPGLVL